MNVCVKLEKGRWWLSVDPTGQATVTCPYCLQEFSLDVFEKKPVGPCPHVKDFYWHSFGYFVLELRRQ